MTIGARPSDRRAPNRGSFRRRAVAIVALTAVSLALAGCVGDDEGTATLSDGAGTQTLPPLTTSTAPPPPAADPTDEPGGSSEGDGADAPETPTTPTEPAAPLQGLAAELIVDGLDQPILVTGAPGTDTLFVVEREGVIRLVTDGTIDPAPFLDVSDRINSNSIEQGLLGLAFHPDYADNGRFFTYWTAPDGTGTVTEFVADAQAGADPAGGTTLLEVPQPGERHNAGMLAFGPDGLLYLSLGDGGAGGREAQDTTNLLGTIVRLDVSEPGRYAIPPGNPFDDEIWVYGLRNPWRFSIDAETGLVYIGDVGQESTEEINVVGLDGAGTNFGWSEAEGDRCFRSGCDLEQFEPPTLEYSHDEGCSVTGGHVYRGAAIPEFTGHYFFGDWCKAFVRSFQLRDGVVRDQFDWTDDMPELGMITSFGVDSDGELLVANWDGGIYRIVPVR